MADNADTEVKGNKKARQINGLVNEWYLEDLSENVHMVFDLKRREGKYIDTPESEWYRVEGTHEAIIDRADFDAAQRSLNLRIRTDGSGEARQLSGLSTMSKCSNGRQSYLRSIRAAHDGPALLLFFPKKRNALCVLPSQPPGVDRKT